MAPLKSATYSGATITPRAVVNEVGYIFSHYTDRENN